MEGADFEISIRAIHFYDDEPNGWWASSRRWVGGVSDHRITPPGVLPPFS